MVTKKADSVEGCDDAQTRKVKKKFPVFYGSLVSKTLFALSSALATTGKYPN